MASSTEHLQRKREIQPSGGPGPGGDLADKIFALQRRTAAASRSSRPLPTPPAILPTPPSPVASSSSARPPPPPIPSSPPRRSAQPNKRAPSQPRSQPIDREEDQEFDRRMPTAAVPTHRSIVPAQSKGRLFNPESDPIPPRSPQLHHLQRVSSRPRDQETTSDTSSLPPLPSSANHHSRRAVVNNNTSRLFDPSKDNPLRFALRPSSSRTAPPPPSTLSATSSTSQSDTRSFGSSAFTLSSATTLSSGASGPQEKRGAGDEFGGGTNPYVLQLKTIYREISALESKVLSSGEAKFGDDAGEHRIRLQGVEVVEKDRWSSIIENHKNLAEADHSLLTLALKPQVPASVRSIPQRYNIPTRMWSLGFHRLLTSLRRSSQTSPRAFELLNDFVYYAYGFYSTLFEDPQLGVFKPMWIEALGDLASYRMAVAVQAMNQSNSPSSPRAPQPPNTLFSKLHLLPTDQPSASTSIQQQVPVPEARIDDSPQPSIGLRAAAELELEIEDEKETWRNKAREWYSLGLNDMPGTGRLHHHLGLLCRDVKGEEVRAVYHFVKSLVATNPYATARESITSFFSPSATRSLALPTSPAPSLCLLLHSMLFARIDLDSFDSTLARFTERLQLDQQPGFGVKESEWVMMGVLNLGAILEYGKEGVLKRVGALGPIGTAPKPKVVEKIVGRGGQRQDSLTIEGGDGHDSHMGPDGGSKWGIDEVMAEPDEMMAISPTDDNEPRSTPAISQPEPPSDHLFQLSLRLTFTLLSLVLKNPYLPHPTRKHYLNPYITIILTFLWTIFKHQPALEVLEKNIPWEELVALLNDTTARRHSRGGSLPEVSSKALIGGGPLPEDHCLRGMEWVGRRVYERGFWRPGAKPNATSSSSCVSGEMDVLTGPLIRQVDDGYVEDGEGGDIEDVPTKRCKRVMLLTEGLVKAVPGLEWDHTSDKPKLRIGGELEVKMREWEEEREREAEEARRRNGRKSWNESDEMDVDEVEEEEEDEEDDDDELDSEDVKALKARRRYLQSLLRPRSQPTRPPQSRRQRPKVQRAVATTTKERPPLNVVPGYTVLVIDTNILLSSLSMIASLVESRRWTLVVPLAVITELDGLSTNPPPLGKAASEALTYLSSSIRTHGMSLKVQTSRGNYLSTLSIRSEQVELDGRSFERNMDDLILRAAVWQVEHFLPTPASSTLASKVVLFTFDRNLRLKARAKQVDAADEKDIASIFAPGT